jgi:hypothetical protein
MVAVNVVDGVKYGFRLLGYLLAVLVVGGILLAIAGSFTGGTMGRGGNPIMALIFGLAGVGVIYAGGLGLMYKVIADGVEVGTLAAEHGGGPPAGHGGFGGAGGASRQSADRSTGRAPQQGQSGQSRGGTQQGDAHTQGGEAGGRGGQGQQPPEDWEPGN